MAVWTCIFYILFFQFYLLKPDHVPKPEKEDISISGNTPDENKGLLEERVGHPGDEKKDK